MKMDWLLIGAITGVAASGAALGVGAVALLRSTPQEAQKSPPPPVLLSSRQPDAAAPPDLYIFSNSPGAAAVTASAAQVPARERPRTSYELFPTNADAEAIPVLATPAPQRIAPVVARPATLPETKKPATVFSLATKTPAPSKPQVEPAPAGAQPKLIDRRYEGVFTPAEIARLKSSLRLTPDQEPLWRPLEAELRKVGKQQMAAVESGGKPDIPRSAYDPLYRAGMPLLQSLRPDQKERVRILARKMGYGAVASMI
jgi:hypothetical protein